MLFRSGENDFAVFKNVFNDYYAKDTSKKIRAVVKMRGEAGEHIASNPPYGYVKDPQNKKKWIVDEESAKVVRRIFDLCIAGKGPMQIAKVLTADRVLTVTAYNARQKGWSMPDNLYQWCAKSVAGILERPEYTGCTVNFKTYTKSLKFKKRMENPKENRRVFEDTQPAIIERGQWERVQTLRANKRRPTKTGKTSIFSGLVYCADCGAKLYYCTCNTYKDESQDHFVCSNYKSNTGSCQIHYIREVTLYRRVLECIQGTLTYVRLFRDDFTQEMLAQDEASRKAELTQKRKAELTQKRKAFSGAQKRMEDLDKIIQRLYEDSVLGGQAVPLHPGGVVGVAGAGLVGKLRIVPGALAAVADNGAQGGAAGFSALQAREKLGYVPLAPGGGQEVPSRPAPVKEGLQLLRVDLLPGGQAVHHHADGSPMGLAKDGHL